MAVDKKKAKRKTVFVLLAAGSGKRFGAYKPIATLKGRPLLYWSLNALERQGKWLDAVVLALPSGWDLAKLKTKRAIPLNFSLPLLSAPGASSRWGSLKNCVRLIQAQVGNNIDFMFVHDAARPLWPSRWIKGMLESLKSNLKASGIVPLADVRETIKRVNGSIRTLPRRDQLKISQTPQLVRWGDFVRALAGHPKDRDFLDEAEALEAAGCQVLPYPGSPFNLKVTFPQDLVMLEGLTEIPQGEFLGAE